MAADTPSWKTGYREGGGGFYLSSPNRDFYLSLMGYGQFTGNFYLDDYRASRSDAQFGFNLRRARVDLLATVQRTYELLIEIGTPSVPAQALGVTGSDVGIVEARVTGVLSGDALQYRIGKFVVPFSAENALSSRAQDTIERSALLSSLIAAGFLDVQTGVMLFGRSGNRYVNYFFGIWNGNGSTVTNAIDDSSFKQIEFKMVFKPTERVAFGLAFDTSHDLDGTFSLLDHAFVPYAAGTIGGRRYGFNVDINLVSPLVTFRSEVTGILFTENGGAPGAVTQLLGAYLHLGLFFTGSKRKGFEGIFRVEWSRLAVTGANSDLISAIFGWNVHLNPNATWMFNYIAEVPNQFGVGAYADKDIKHMVLNQLQVKF